MKLISNSAASPELSLLLADNLQELQNPCRRDEMFLVTYSAVWNGSAV